MYRVACKNILFCLWKEKVKEPVRFRTQTLIKFKKRLIHKHRVESVYCLSYSLHTYYICIYIYIYTTLREFVLLLSSSRPSLYWYLFFVLLVNSGPFEFHASTLTDTPPEWPRSDCSYNSKYTTRTQSLLKSALKKETVTFSETLVVYWRVYTE